MARVVRSRHTSTWGGNTPSVFDVGNEARIRRTGLQRDAELGGRSQESGGKRQRNRRRLQLAVGSRAEGRLQDWVCDPLHRRVGPGHRDVSNGNLRDRQLRIIDIAPDPRELAGVVDVVAPRELRSNPGLRNVLFRDRDILHELHVAVVVEVEIACACLVHDHLI